ncbi:hypothetical protein KR009_009907, partial [Drosophila setifemur]
MDVVKLKKMEDAVRIGGKGSVRRKHKHVPNSSNVEEKRLQATLAKLPLNQVPGIQQISVIMQDGSEVMIPTPKVQGSVVNNLFVISGELIHIPGDTKNLPEVSGKGKGKGKGKMVPTPVQLKAAQLKDQMKSQMNKQVQVPVPEPQPPQQQQQPPKKTKKQRNRIRKRNKRAQMLLQLAEGGDNNSQAGGGSIGSVGTVGKESDDDREGGGDSGSKDLDDYSGEDLNLSQELSEDGSNYSADSDHTNVLSDSSDMDQTVVGDEDDVGIF